LPAGSAAAEGYAPGASGAYHESTCNATDCTTPRRNGVETMLEDLQRAFKELNEKVHALRRSL
jgi:hypothetical protein